MATTTTLTNDPLVQKLAGTPKKPGRVFQASVAKPDEAIWRKVLLIGRSGIGKTRAFAGALLAGHRVFVADTDFGGNGLSTVHEALKEAGRTELLENLAWFEFASYKDWCYFVDHPESVMVNGMTLWDWNPDVLGWDGVANFQERDVVEYSLELAPLAREEKVSEAREAGLWADRTDWGVIRRATLFAVDRFLRLHNPSGKKLHKIVTVLQDAGKEDRLTKENRRGPLLMGAARDYMPAGFDLILTLDAMTKLGSNPKVVEYSYKCDVTDNGVVSKRRGLQVAAREPANFEVLWRRICELPE